MKLHLDDPRVAGCSEALDPLLLHFGRQDVGKINVSYMVPVILGRNLMFVYFIISLVSNQLLMTERGGDFMIDSSAILWIIQISI